MKNLLSEPLVHFAVLGALLFAYFSVLDDGLSEVSAEQGISDQIVITETDAQQLVVQYEAVWQRPPTPEDMQSLIASQVKEEILVREALALGLDRGDAAIRNRLRQKMLFLTDSAAQAMEPDEEVLKQHLLEQADQFMVQARVTLEQVFLGETTDDAAIAAAQARLAAGDDPRAVGVGSLLPVDVENASPAQLDAAFGSGFFETVTQSGPGTWEGPVRSGYGYHLVRVNELTAAKPAELADVRDKVLFDWRRVQAQELADAQIGALRERYDIQTPDEDVLQSVLSQ